MNQEKTGLFLKELRKERKLTQEQLAEHFNISSRSVSRWETGTNLPDLTILVELADFYDIDIREIIDGERKNEMNTETKETLTKVAEYVDQDKAKLKKRMAGNCTGATLLLVFCSILQLTGGFNGAIPERSLHNLLLFTMGGTVGILVLTIIYLTGNLEKAQKIKNKLFRKQEVR